MEYDLIAVPETDVAWNSIMEDWWNNGGALLWNRFGGFGKDRLTLSEDDLRSFLEQAESISGWQSLESSTPRAIGPANPIIIEKSCGNTSPEEESEIEEPIEKYCCRDCGRDLHAALTQVRGESISIDKRRLNHLLNSLQEAIDYSGGRGPNNVHTWKAALQDFVESVTGK